MSRLGSTWHPAEPVRWENPLQTERDLDAACAQFAAHVGKAPWQIAWCAGAGVVGSLPDALEQETLALSALLEAMTRHLCLGGRARGAFFLASSAGGVYAGAGHAPFTEESPVAPLAPYGWNKLDQEGRAWQWCASTGTPLLVGRISNLYGPAQNLAKAQGLISQVCLRVLMRQPLALYVSLDTIRDYLFADDAGDLIAGGLERLQRLEQGHGEPPAVIKILASQQPTTVGSILAQSRWITKRPVSVLLAGSPNARHQARDLRMASNVWPELDDCPKTTLSEGMRAVFTSMLSAAGAGNGGGVQRAADEYRVLRVTASPRIGGCLPRRTAHVVVARSPRSKNSLTDGGAGCAQ
ncbi:MAG: NAD-dependent epimerase/dehydratase family protein [Acidimicrobiaceae bacterium]|nr:NAD-dependent epimerase/dehydratase family protein [Acidimicrobiaceae bacterium]